MSLDVHRSPDCLMDLARTLEYLLRCDAIAAAERFVEAFDDTLDDIAQFPELGSPWESRVRPDRPLRYRPVKGFDNYLVFYRSTSRRIQALRLLHGSQDLEGLI